MIKYFMAAIDNDETEGGWFFYHDTTRHCEYPDTDQIDLEEDYNSPNVLAVYQRRNMIEVSELEYKIATYFMDNELNVPEELIKLVQTRRRLNFQTSLNKRWKQLETEFSSFVVDSVGGGMFSIRKDYRSLAVNKKIMVIIGEDGALVYVSPTESTKFITSAEFDNAWDDWELWKPEELISRGNSGQVEIHPLMTDLFDLFVAADIYTDFMRFDYFNSKGVK